MCCLVNVLFICLLEIICVNTAGLRAIGDVALSYCECNLAC
jgi:hypothetical protein